MANLDVPQFYENPAKDKSTLHSRSNPTWSWDFPWNNQIQNPKLQSQLAGEKLFEPAYYAGEDDAPIRHPPYLSKLVYLHHNPNNIRPTPSGLVFESRIRQPTSLQDVLQDLHHDQLANGGVGSVRDVTIVSGLPAGISIDRLD
ncbi:START-like domain superfamily [Forsythia ovata]|uniref:START-like domain superfamily n=1 Tax=Forsythia ovata TaxID=205694 RepID=A0ABD1RLL2_9LAMI